MTAPDPLRFEVGPKEIYDELKAVGAKVDRLTDTQSLTIVRGDDHEQRIRALERSRWPVQSVGILISIAALAISYMGGK